MMICYHCLVWSFWWLDPQCLNINLPGCRSFYIKFFTCVYSNDVMNNLKTRLLRHFPPIQFSTCFVSWKYLKYLFDVQNIA